MSGKGFMHAGDYERNTRALEGANKRKRAQLEADKEALNLEEERFSFEIRKAQWLLLAPLRAQLMQAVTTVVQQQQQQQQQQQGGPDQYDDDDA
jgi:hypothetical protein